MTKPQKLALAGLALGVAALVLCSTGGERRAGRRGAPDDHEASEPRAGAARRAAVRPQAQRPGGSGRVVVGASSLPSTGVRPFTLQRTLALEEWRHQIRPEIDRCLPVPGADAAPHPVQVVFEWQGEISGPTLQRFAVSAVTPIGLAKAPPEVLACLDRLRGTTVNVEATEDALVAGESRFTDLLDLRWASGKG